ncbi:uncharacterized protein TNCV_3205331 [Trichonephila clavipes]|nr:uncharacterized protein TNCV_3205331 [Trichonephila clavipes]
MWSMVAQRLIQITPPAATADQLWQRVEAAWSAVPQEHTQSLFESMPRRVAAWVQSHVGIPGNERANQKAKQGTESTQPEVPLTLRRAKSIISTHIDKYTAMTQKTKSFGKPWETGHCGPNPEAPGESRGCCPFSPNYRT